MLDVSVCIDVFMTETARESDYLLPATSQYEKFEATFFNFDFPKNVFHLRRPVLEPPIGPLPEPEIHARLVDALGFLDKEIVEQLRAARPEPRRVRHRVRGGDDKRPEAGRCRAGRAVPHARGNPPARRRGGSCAMADGDPLLAAQPRRRRQPASSGPMPATGSSMPSSTIRPGVVFTEDTWEATWQRIKPTTACHVGIPESSTSCRTRREAPPGDDSEWPLLLSAGERRSFTANTILANRRGGRRTPRVRCAFRRPMPRGSVS